MGIFNKTLLPNPNYQHNQKFGCKLQFQMNSNQLENIILDVQLELKQQLHLLNGLKVVQRMNLVLGSSEHTIEVLKESKFEKRDQKTNQTSRNY
jgi:hypothetical protein